MKVIKAFVPFLCFLFPVGVTLSQTITLNICGIRNKEGSLCIGIFNSSHGFDSDQPFRKLIIGKANVSGGKLIVKVPSLTPGSYGIALLDDENKNGKMDYRLFLPAEGCGFSNYRHSGIRRPDFGDFDFEITGGDKIVEVRVKYY